MYLAEHFVRAPQWTWYILFYFFFAGLAGGSYVIGTLLRLSRDSRDEGAARTGFYVSLAATILCPLLLTADLGPVSWSRFWHMLIDVTPGETGISFKYWSPMSVGAWALLVFGFFAFVSALDAWSRDRRGSALLPPGVDLVFAGVGSLVGLFLASYTGVLLSVSNQPIWSDTWALGGLFLASGLSAAAAAITLLIRYRSEAGVTLQRLRVADSYIGVLELALLIAFFATLAAAGVASTMLVWIPLWIVVLIGIGASLIGFRRPAHVAASGETAARTAPVSTEATVIAAIVLLAVLALRAAVIFSAQ